MMSILCFGLIRTRVMRIPKKKVCNFVGGVLSPILANIYLHMLDCKIRQAIEVFNIGRRRKRNPTYKNLQGKIRWMRKKVTRETNPERIKTSNKVSRS